MRHPDRKVLKAVWPNAALRAAYRARLDKLVAEMQRSYAWFVKAQYKETPPAMAMDATPAHELRRELKRLGARWEARFEDAAPKLAAWFAQTAARRSDAALEKILRDAGFTVRFKVTKAMRDVLDAKVAENVALIKSIASEYHTQVEGLVMRSVTEGRDLAFLANRLEDRYRITRKRAAFISLDQNNKATSAMMAARQTSIGLEEGIWLHSHAGKEPRPTHLANDGKRFSLREGWFDPDPKVRMRILPGQLIRCRCAWRPVVKGFS